MPLTVIALLYAGDGGMEALTAFEAEVLPIIADHDGRLEKAFAPDLGLSAFDDPPDEVHILAFPSASAFDEYRADPRHGQLAAARARAIRKTLVVAADQMKAYAAR